MYTVILEDGFQFSASLDDAYRVIRDAKITKKYARGPLSVIECEEPWTSADGEGNAYSGISRFTVACPSSVNMAELLRAWSSQF